MAGSSGTLLDHEFLNLLLRAPDLNRVLDVGAGAGKYGALVRRHRPSVRDVVALEAYGPYVDQFALQTIYSKVIIGLAISLLDDPNEKWDLVILGDVLEHMPKSIGLDVLHFLVYRTRYLWLQWPIRYLQGPEAGNDLEAHISVWSEDDVSPLQTSYVRYAEVPLEAYAVDGYLNAGLRVADF